MHACMYIYIHILLYHLLVKYIYCITEADQGSAFVCSSFLLLQATVQTAVGFWQASERRQKLHSCTRLISSGVRDYTCSRGSNHGPLGSLRQKGGTSPACFHISSIRLRSVLLTGSTVTASSQTKSHNLNFDPHANGQHHHQQQQNSLASSPPPAQYNIFRMSLDVQCSPRELYLR